ncbi:unnamed protein product [Microthlaspi erraticum]|uniref:Uncharacterized protein n=1 Tax=Microthlaspi erraticum TaxID=1685480 RepID=A0A6D2HLB4_9BRAS|nr:unnamed protein product [Microthlaspi erraticum]
MDLSDAPDDLPPEKQMVVEWSICESALARRASEGEVVCVWSEAVRGSDSAGEMVQGVKWLPWSSKGSVWSST